MPIYSVRYLAHPPAHREGLTRPFRRKWGRPFLCSNPEYPDTDPFWRKLARSARAFHLASARHVLTVGGYTQFRVVLRSACRYPLRSVSESAPWRVDIQVENAVAVEPRHPIGRYQHGRRGCLKDCRSLYKVTCSNLLQVHNDCLIPLRVPVDLSHTLDRGARQFGGPLRLHGQFWLF